MKLTQEHVGKTVRSSGWYPGHVFVPHFFSKDGRVWGKDSGFPGIAANSNQNWDVDLPNGEEWELVPEETPEPATLSLLEIFQQDDGAGREFRNADNQDNYKICHETMYDYEFNCRVDITKYHLEARYIWVEEKKVEVTAKQIREAFAEWRQSDKTYRNELEDDFLARLGL